MKTFSQRASLAFAGLFLRGMALARKVTEAKMPKSQARRQSPPGKIYDFTVKTIDGKEQRLSDYKGSVLMIVNTASLCGLTPQYDSLETLYQQYKSRGFKLLAFPANEFGSQEPGTSGEIKEFCRTRFSITFDLFDKIVVKGEGIHPLYKFLTTESGHNGAIAWNFAKFLVDKTGAVAARFEPPTDPMGKSVVQKIEELLNA